MIWKVAAVSASVTDAAASSTNGAWPLALLSGLAGALLVFMLGVLREVIINRRKCLGLLRLLMTEMRHNQLVLYRTYSHISKLKEYPSPEDISLTEPFQFGAWENARVHLAELLPSDAFTPISEHYADLQGIVDAAQGTERLLGPPRTIVTRTIGDAEKSRIGARMVLERYLGGEAQDTGQALWLTPDEVGQIEATLREARKRAARPWYRRLFRG